MMREGYDGGIDARLERVNSLPGMREGDRIEGRMLGGRMLVGSRSKERHRKNDQ